MESTRNSSGSLIGKFGVSGLSFSFYRDWKTSTIVDILPPGNIQHGSVVDVKSSFSGCR